MIEIAVIRLCSITEEINTLLTKRRLALKLFRGKGRVSFYFFLVNHWMPKESLGLFGTVSDCLFYREKTLAYIPEYIASKQPGTSRSG
jgi:hypothetical protein